MVRNKKLFLFLSGLLLTMVNGVGLKGQDRQLLYGKEVVIHSSVLDENRKIFIHTPPAYDQEQTQYPVLYLLDGEAHFFHATGIVDFLTRLGYMPETIVVGITNTDRTRDFSPTHVSDMPSSGGADRFLAFLEKELIPYIDGNYRTAPFRILEGHSFGGTFAVYSLLREPELFGGYIVISPYLHYDDSFLLKEAQSALRSKYRSPKYFFMTMADELDYFEPLKQFSALIKSRCSKSIQFEYRIMDKENHGSVPHLGIYYGLKHIFSPWLMPQYRMQAGLESILAFYAGLSEKYGYEVELTEGILNQLGYLYLGNQDYKSAIEVFTENVRRHPNSPNVYDSLGEAFERSGDRIQALENYRKAVVLASEQGNANLEYFRKNAARLEAH